jgi:hypothetical protein
LTITFEPWSPSAPPEFRDDFLRSVYEDPLFTKPIGFNLDKTPRGVKMYDGKVSGIRKAEDGMRKWDPSSSDRAGLCRGKHAEVGKNEEGEKSGR